MRFEDEPDHHERCDHWALGAEHQCRRFWTLKIVLTNEVNVPRGPMIGRYHPATWHFCNMHYRIFNRDREHTYEAHAQSEP